MHTKGEWAGQPFELEPWQRNEIIRPTFGWKRRSDGMRRYRVIYVEVARKNGKSSLAAGIALLLLHCDQEPGAEVYSAAADRLQAAIVFDQAAIMCRHSKRLASRSEIYRREIFVPHSRSYYRVLSADVKTKHGFNPHGIIFDELHVQDSRDLWDTLRTGRGARRQPLIVALTTAGFDLKTICGEMHQKALAVKKGTVKDPTFLPIVYGTTDKDDWEKPRSWEKANPNLGVSVRMEYLAGEYQEAKDSPAYQNTFRRLHLNQWVHQATRWLDMKKWNRCGGRYDWSQMAKRLEGRPCLGGLDLSTVTDLSAFVLLFDTTIKAADSDYPTEKEAAVKSFTALPGWEYGDPLPAYDILCQFWCPAEGIALRAKKDRMPYDIWRDQGALVATEGDAVDHGAIRKEIKEMGSRFLIEEIAVDAWNAHKLITELQDQDGYIISRVSQGYGQMTAPTKELDALYRRRQIRHGGHPVLAWCADNVTLDRDPYDNWKPSKKKSRERIDGIVALVMALGRMLTSRGTIEDGRGIESI